MRRELTPAEKRERRWALGIIRSANPNEPDENRVSPSMVEYAAETLDRLEGKDD